MTLKRKRLVSRQALEWWILALARDLRRSRSNGAAWEVKVASAANIRNEFGECLGGGAKPEGTELRFGAFRIWERTA